MERNKLKKGIISKDNGFLVQFLYILFYWAERISIFYWIRVIGEKLNKNKDKKPFVKTYIFPEIWAVGNVMFAGIISFQLLKTYKIKWLAWILILYAVLRTFEMIIYQINVLFFHRLNTTFREIPTTNSTSGSNEEYRIKSATRTVLLLILNMVEYVFQFAVMFAGISILSNNNEINIGMLQSFELFMNMSNIEDYSNRVFLMPVYIETLIGLFMNILCLARFVGILPEVKTIDKC